MHIHTTLYQLCKNRPVLKGGGEKRSLAWRSIPAFSVLHLFSILLENKTSKLIFMQIFSKITSFLIYDAFYNIQQQSVNNTNLYVDDRTLNWGHTCIWFIYENSVNENV